MVRLAVLAALALLAAGCAGDDDEPRRASAGVRACPQEWKAGWQRLANRVGAPVFCPSWMPNPLTAEIGGPWDNGVSVDKGDSYLVSFVWHEHGNDVHVNFRGYPGQVGIPRCDAVSTVAGKTRRQKVPCFSDARGTKRLAGKQVTMYTVGRDADQWHIVYAWRTNGSLYAVSEHVAPPFSYSRVVSNLDRLVRGLTLVRPQPS